MIGNAVLNRNKKTLITLLSLLAVSTVSAITKLEDLEKAQCQRRYPAKMGETTDCWYFKDESVGIYAIQGDRPGMEDRILFEKNIGGSKLSIYGVFDGHGGDKAVNFVVDNLMEVLKEELKQLEGLDWDEEKKQYLRINYKPILKDTLAKVEENLLKEMRKIKDLSGCTATIAFIDEDRQHLYIANIGDSRAIMSIDDNSGKAFRLSVDHKPEDPEELQRIKEAGGRPQYFYWDWRLGGLNMSRALGDIQRKDKYHLIADPDTFIFDLSRYKPKTVILASDGIESIVSKNAVVALTDSYFETGEKYFGAEAIGAMAYARGSGDNISVLVVKTGL